MRAKCARCGVRKCAVEHLPYCLLSCSHSNTCRDRATGGDVSILERAAGSHATRTGVLLSAPPPLFWSSSESLTASLHMECSLSKPSSSHFSAPLSRTTTSRNSARRTSRREPTVGTMSDLPASAESTTMHTRSCPLPLRGRAFHPSRRSQCLMREPKSSVPRSLPSESLPPPTRASTADSARGSSGWSLAAPWSTGCCPCCCEKEKCWSWPHAGVSSIGVQPGSSTSRIISKLPHISTRPIHTYFTRPILAQSFRRSIWG
mmetsp:Transcript_29579/g.94926  ORF Transcript_29579/g.94926 Transcript_29579/m.94926 type:complete len:261 (-) Transcript_29579:166-948(-)